MFKLQIAKKGKKRIPNGTSYYLWDKATNLISAVGIYAPTHTHTHTFTDVILTSL
jgi:hypothetical protein